MSLFGRGASIVLLTCVLAACAQAPDLPSEVAVRVYQTRSDVAVGAIEIQVHNGSATDITVSRALLRSPLLADPALYDRVARIPAGATVDLKTVLPDAACHAAAPSSAESGPSEASIDVTFQLDGRVGQETLAARDSLGQLRAITEAACLHERVERIVTIRQPSEPHFSEGMLSLTYRFAPTGEPGSVMLIATGPTTLLSPATSDGRQVATERIGVRMAAPSSPRRVVVHYVPARCDAHAIAENKQGTLLPISVELDSAAGSYTLPVDAGLRSQIQRGVARICGLS